MPTPPQSEQVQPDGELAADNTDWLGIHRLLDDNLKDRGSPVASSLVGLVVGGGGTARAACYALKQLGVGQLFVFNRSKDKAVTLANDFGGSTLDELEAGAAALPRLDLVVSCVPGSAGLTLTEELLRKRSPIVLDAAYRPRETPLLAAARASGCVAIEGIEMLFEQGCAQCELWTHRAAPRAEIVQGLSIFLASQDFGPLPPRLANILKQLG